MHAQQRPTADEAVQAFVFCVGKAIQNYGTIKYLVNELLVLLTADALIASHLIKQGISKRLEILESLVSRRQDDLSKQGIIISDLFTSARAAFQGRNKIAHNPFVVRAKNVEGKTEVTVGIHVVRYHEAGHKEEWINREKLEGLTTKSSEIAERFNKLLKFCKPPIS